LADDLSLSFPGPCMHEVLFDDRFLKDTGVTTLDFAKALIDEGYHPMTMYFPLIVHGAMLIEPTETESKVSLDQFVAVVKSLAAEAWIIADHVIDAALCGYEYSGLAKILNIPEHRRFKRPRHAMKVLRETEISTLYDGGNNVGMLVMYHAARAAIDKAATRGIAVVG